MTQLSQIETLMEELGPVLDPVSIEAFPKDRHWIVILDEETVCFIDFDEEQNKLIFRCPLGDPAGDRLSLYETLLVYNGLWTQESGCWMGLEEGMVVQLYEDDADVFDVPRLTHVLQKFRDIARDWSKIVTSPTASTASLPHQSDTDNIMG